MPFSSPLSKNSLPQTLQQLPTWYDERGRCRSKWARGRRTEGARRNQGIMAGLQRWWVHAHINGRQPGDLGRLFARRPGRALNPAAANQVAQARFNFLSRPRLTTLSQCAAPV